MPIIKAQELLASPNTSLGNLLDCLAELSDNKGYLQAVKRFKVRDADNAEENIRQIEVYIQLIKNRIQQCIN